MVLVDLTVFKTIMYLSEPGGVWNAYCSNAYCSQLVFQLREQFLQNANSLLNKPSNDSEQIREMLLFTEI